MAPIFSRGSLKRAQPPPHASGGWWIAKPDTFAARPTIRGTITGGWPAWAALK